MIRKSIVISTLALTLLSGVVMANTVSFKANIPNGPSAAADYGNKTYNFSYCQRNAQNVCDRGVEKSIGSVYEAGDGTLESASFAPLEGNNGDGVLILVNVSYGLPGAAMLAAGPTEVVGSYVSLDAKALTNSLLTVTFDPLHSSDWRKVN